VKSAFNRLNSSILIRKTLLRHTFGDDLLLEVIFGSMISTFIEHHTQEPNVINCFVTSSNGDEAETDVCVADLDRGLEKRRRTWREEWGEQCILLNPNSTQLPDRKYVTYH
jgi:hypothetical protein